MKRIVCFGSATIDILMKSKDFKVLKSHQVQGGIAMCEVYGGKMGVEEMELAIGGAGTNVAVGLSRLGFITASVTRVGSDLFGKQILNELSLEKVENSQVQVDKEGRTGTSVVLVADGGGRSIVTYRGVSKEVNAAEIDWEKVERSDWIHLSGMGGNLTFAEDVINFASNKRIGLSWNPGKGELMEREKIKELVPKVEILIINRMEASQLLGHQYEEEEKIAASLLRMGIKRAVVTEGNKGVSWIEKGKIIKMKAFRVSSIDDTGAGDGFCTGLIAGMLSGKETEVAMKMGVAEGASVVTELGAKKGLLRSKEMERWLRRKLVISEEQF
jgi:ribokinase